VSKQLTLALRVPAEHIDFVHTEKRMGTILVWKQQDSSRQWIKVGSPQKTELKVR